VFATVDAVAEAILHKTVSSRIFGHDPPDPAALFAKDPEVLQLAIFGVSLSVHRMLRARGADFDVLAGHSLGEIAALVSGGAFTAHDGAEIICHRIAATTQVSPAAGGMVSLACDQRRAGQLLELIGDADLCVAAVNGPGQVVVSGPSEGLRKVEAIAAALGITAVPLLATAAFHTPRMAEVRAEAVRRLRDQPRHRRQRPLRRPVYSPILGRFYRDADDLVELLGLHLVTPVRFDTAIAALHAAGARIFVELGAGGTMTGLVKAALPEVTTWAPLSGRAARRGLDATASLLHIPGTGARDRAGDGATDDLPIPAGDGARHGDGDGAGGDHDRAAARAAVPVIPAPAAAVPPAQPPAEAAAAAARDAILAVVRRTYAEALEYPEEVLTEDAHLEADLGVDSIKRTEVLARLRGHFGLGAPAAGLRPGDYLTVGAVTDLISASVSGERNGAAG